MKRKNKIKSVVSMLLLGIAIIFVFTACGSTKAPDSADITKENVLGDFQTVDVNGNAVDKTVFSGKTLTMVNIWGTYCNPCIKEMPTLGDLNREYADKGFQIVGIPIDAPPDFGNIDEYVITTVKDITKEADADYVNILPSKDLTNNYLAGVNSIPETIFVDENGNQIGDSYVGAKSKEQWKTIIDGFLKSMKK